MKITTVLAVILSLSILASCDSDKKLESKKEIKEIVVKTMALKKERLKEVKSYFGTLKFSMATNFVAQQSGVISKLNVVPGQKVSKGETIVIYPPINHQLQIDQARIQLNKTVKDYNRQKELYEIGAVTKVSVEDYKVQLDIEKKTIQQLQGINIVIAPFSGIITQVHVNLGQEVGMDMPIFAIAKTGNIQVDFYVLSKEISEMKLNTPVYFMKDNKKINGKITKKSIQLDEQRRAYLVTATFDNNDILFVGDIIDIFVETGKPLESIWIPISAYRKHRNSYYVYVLEENRAQKKDIIVGKRNEELVQVKEGLNDTDQLIIAGIDKLKDNILVKSIPRN
ncbi:efflux RND transporter periplasmic adaptor subunit [uncultured Maribacter sp.]|uniref:efflux RND transporter periplasmic adaptor subunit n=1 Tax=uncultured Maribacter sp. TaxID=431308 RepID=UPI00260EB34A|nr:efflux RND transporter periplasmic adaptor subunit [uncultured Maribacter sp.]